MRLWSLHPELLDQKGLVAVWREGLLAQAVLSGKTRGYRHHPQLIRFQQKIDPLSHIGAYLFAIQKEANRRGYRFDVKKITYPEKILNSIPVTTGQLQYELQHLYQKLQHRDPDWLESKKQFTLLAHPLFQIVAGPIATWEKINSLVHTTF